MDNDALMRAASDIDIDMCIRLWQRPEWLFGRCARHGKARQGILGLIQVGSTRSVARTGVLDRWPRRILIDLDVNMLVDRQRVPKADAGIRMQRGRGWSSAVGGTCCRVVVGAGWRRSARQSRRLVAGERVRIANVFRDRWWRRRWRRWRRWRRRWRWWRRGLRWWRRRERLTTVGGRFSRRIWAVICIVDVVVDVV